jgi:glycosyltransferase involved in cell wall biosynthesis
MNILFLDQFSELGGAQQCLYDLIPGIIDRGWTAHAALPPGGPLGANLSRVGAIVHEIALGDYTNGSKSVSDMLRFAWETPSLARAIKRLVNEHRIDIVYVNGPRVLPAAALACGRIVFHSHSLLSTTYSRVLAGMSVSIRRATVIASSRFVANPLKRYVASERLHVVYNGVRDYGPGAIRDFENCSPRIGLIGRIAPEKGQIDFIRAARLLLAAAPDCSFVICGTPMFSRGDYMARVQKLAEGLPMQFLGWRTDIDQVLGELDVLAAPSMQVDATPRVIMEAFSAGLPVVAYPSGGIPELIEHGVNGILTSDASAESLANAMLELLRDREKMRLLGVNARQSFLSRFSAERYRQEVLSILERV